MYIYIYIYTHICYHIISCYYILLHCSIAITTKVSRDLPVKYAAKMIARAAAKEGRKASHTHQMC